MAQPHLDFEYNLWEVVKKGKISTVKKLLGDGKIDYLKDTRYFDYNLVIEAFYKSEVAIAKLLIDKGCRVYKKSNNTKYTILHYVVQLGDIDLIKTLLARGASHDILTPNEQKKTPFHLAIDNDQSSIIELFLAQFDVKYFDVEYFLDYAIREHTIPVVSQLIGNCFLLTSIAKENKNLKVLDILLTYCSVKKMIPNNNDDTVLVCNASISLWLPAA